MIVVSTYAYACLTKYSTAIYGEYFDVLLVAILDIYQVWF